MSEVRVLSTSLATFFIEQVQKKDKSEGSEEQKEEGVHYRFPYSVSF